MASLSRLDHSQAVPLNNGARNVSVSLELAKRVESLRKAMLNHRKLQACNDVVEEAIGGAAQNVSESREDGSDDANRQSLEEYERIDIFSDTGLRNHEQHVESCDGAGRDTMWSEQDGRIESLRNAALESRKRKRCSQQDSAQGDINVAGQSPCFVEQTEAEALRTITKRPTLKLSEKTKNLKNALLQSRRRKAHIEDVVHAGDNGESGQEAETDSKSTENAELSWDALESRCSIPSQVGEQGNGGLANLKCEAFLPELQAQPHQLENAESKESLDKPVLQRTLATGTNAPCHLSSNESPKNPSSPSPLAHLSPKQKLDSCSNALAVIIERINKAAAMIDCRREVVVFNRTLQQVNRLRQSKTDDVRPSSKDDELLLKNLPIVLEFLSTLLKYENNLNKRLLVPVIKLLRSCRVPDARETSTHALPATSPRRAKFVGPPASSTTAGGNIQPIRSGGSASPSLEMKRDVYAFYPERIQVPAALEAAANLNDTLSHDRITMLRNDIHRIQAEIDDCISRTLDISSYIHLLDIEKMKALDLQEEEENRIATLRMQLTLAIRMIHAQSSLAGTGPAKAAANDSDKAGQDTGPKD